MCETEEVSGFSLSVIVNQYGAIKNCLSVDSFLYLWVLNRYLVGWAEILFECSRGLEEELMTYSVGFWDGRTF